MLSQITNNREEMNAKGITNQYLDNWVSSLTERADIQRDKGVFAWGVFVARKPSRESCEAKRAASPKPQPRRTALRESPAFACSTRRQLFSCVI